MVAGEDVCELEPDAGGCAGDEGGRAAGRGVSYGVGHVGSGCLFVALDDWTMLDRYQPSASPMAEASQAHQGELWRE